MEKAINTRFANPINPFLGQDPVKIILLAAILVVVVLAIIFGPCCDSIPLEDLWE